MDVTKEEWLMYVDSHMLTVLCIKYFCSVASFKCLYHFCSVAMLNMWRAQ